MKIKDTASNQKSGHQVSKVKATSNDEKTLYHGTSSFFSPQILKSGLRPLNVAGVVWFTPALSRAVEYAKAWAVGLNTAGVTTKGEAVIFGFTLSSLPNNAQFGQGQRSEFYTAGPIPTVTVIKTIDCMNVSEVARFGHLMNICGALGYNGGYVADFPFEWQVVLEKIAAAIRETPPEVARKASDQCVKL